jgi:hypothetical protein
MVQMNKDRKMERMKKESIQHSTQSAREQRQIGMEKRTDDREEKGTK